MSHRMRPGDRVRRVREWMGGTLYDYPRVGDLGTVIESNNDTAAVVFDRITGRGRFSCYTSSLRYIGWRVNPEKL